MSESTRTVVNVVRDSLLLEIYKDALPNLFISSIGYYPDGDMKNSNQATEADDMVLVYCESGEGLTDWRGIDVSVRANQFIITPVRHLKIRSSTYRPWSIYRIHFKGEAADFFSQEEPTPVNVYIGSRLNPKLSIFQEMLEVLQGMKDHLESIRYASSVLYEFLSAVHYQTVVSKREHAKQKVEADIVDIALQFLHDHLADDITLQDVVAHVKCSQSKLSAQFRTRTGKTIMGYLQEIRIAKACQLLKETDSAINQVAKAIGIDDPLYFSRVFSRAMGMSPKEYRGKYAIR